MAAPNHGRESRVMGEPLSMEVDLEVEVSDAENAADIPGLGWTLSDETLIMLNEIDANLRAAEQMSGRLVVG